MTQLEKIWEERLEEVYPRLFGALDEKIYPLQPELFVEVFNQQRYNPKWLSFAVVVSPPNPDRDTWLYLSSGISDPWDDGTYEPQPDEYSGMGAEWVLETVSESPWAISLLQTVMGYHILTIEGEMGHVPAPTYGDGIRLGRSILGEQESTLQNLLIVKPVHYPSSFRIRTGHADIFHLIGITDNEYLFGETHGNDALIEKLAAGNLLGATLPERNSLE